MNHYLLVKREGVTPEGKILSASESAGLLLQSRIWPLWKATRNRKAVKAADKVAVYLSGHNNQIVIATATVKEQGPWSRTLARAYPLVLDGEPESVLHLDNIVTFDDPRPVKPKLHRLSFYNGGPKWGVAFMGGTRALSAQDYAILIS